MMNQQNKTCSMATITGGTMRENDLENKPHFKRRKPKARRQSFKYGLDCDLLFQGISNPKKRRFLAAFAQCGSVGTAAKQAKVHWSTHYKWLREEDNVAYTEAFNRARDIAGDLAEGEIYRRAFLGFDHPVIYEGEITDNYKSYSDNLAMFWLKGLKPERYRDNVNLSGSVGLPVDDFYNRIAAREREEKKF
jgi:hypothetical protein